MGNPEVEGADAVVLEAWQVSWWASPGSTGHVCEWRWVDRQRIREAEVMCNLYYRATNQGKTSEKHEPNKRTGSLSNTNIPVDRAVRQQVRGQAWAHLQQVQMLHLHLLQRCRAKRAKRKPLDQTHTHPGKEKPIERKKMKKFLTFVFKGQPIRWRLLKWTVVFSYITA